MRSRSRALLVVLLLVAAACADDAEGGDDAARAEPLDVSVQDADHCDPLDPTHCLLPFPSDTFTVDDADTDTGRRLALDRAAMPANVDGVRADPEGWNRNDGFSPGQPITVRVPGIDVTGLADAGNIGPSLDDDADVVLLDADTGERHPYWVELDDRAPSPEEQVLYIRPAVNYPEGHRMVVAIRNQSAPPPEVFVGYRDGRDMGDPVLEGRRERFDRVFDDLEAAGVERDESLWLAWDFTVASERNLTERILHMRDDAFDALDSDAPAFTVTEVEEDEDRRTVRGTFEVPLYLDGGGQPGSRMAFGDGDVPARTGTFTAPFRCTVPTAWSGGPLRPVVYGHGLLGSEDEVGARNIRLMTNEHGYLYCATRWIGMSEEDVGNAVNILNDLSGFPTLADRSQQGILNTLFLGRLLIHEAGLSSDPAIGAEVDRSDLFYDGNSQGGIMGAAATAVAIDWTRAVLGVPGMNYSTLLQRSVDWDTYEAILVPAYPDYLDRVLAISLIQILWDRGEGNGYAHHLTNDPLPGTPEHQVLLHVAFGDHQVSQHAAEVEARTIGARIRCPALADGRAPDADPHWGLECAEDGFDGSVLVYWDSGAPPPPLVNQAPREGQDPHEDPRMAPAAREQKAAWMSSGGTFVDTCGDEPCTAEPVG